MTRDDILQFDLDCHPVLPTDQRVFAERVIHGATYKLRPDVMAVCHHHAPGMARRQPPVASKQHCVWSGPRAKGADDQLPLVT